MEMVEEGSHTDWQNFVVGEVDVDGALGATRSSGNDVGDFEGWGCSGNVVRDGAGKGAGRKGNSAECVLHIGNVEWILSLVERDGNMIKTRWSRQYMLPKMGMEMER